MNDRLFLEMLDKLYFHRDDNAIKSDNGRSLLIGSSKNFPNATLIAAEAAILSGNGYNAVSVPDEIYPIVFSRLSPLCIYEGISNEKDEFESDIDFSFLAKYDSVLFGNGAVVSEKNYQFMNRLISETDKNLLLDASALRLLSQYGTDALAKKKKETKILLTPHLGEANSLLNAGLHSRNPKDYLEKALAFCEKYQVYMLLKSVSSILVTPEKKYFISSYPSTPSLGKAGSGDGLSGYLTGLLSFAEKYFSYSDIISFGDQMIHLSMKELEKKSSPALHSILSLKDGMKLYLKSIKKQ